MMVRLSINPPAHRPGRSLARRTLPQSPQGRERATRRPGQVIEWDGTAWATVSGGSVQGSGNDPLSAREAIARGADPAAAKQRLQQNGIDLSGL
jgi:hypothetical protein